MGGGRISDYRLLVRLGADLPGAVAVEAATEPDGRDDPTVADIEPDAADHPLRYSLAGVQLKYSVHSSRLTLPSSGAGSWWIVKLPDRSIPSLAENEYLTMRWIGAAGMDTPRVELSPAGSVSELPSGFVQPDDLLYLTERYDRSPTGRVHVEDFAQVADVDPREKYGEFGATYDSMGTVVSRLLGEEGLRAYLERLVAMVITGNTDAHLKNWSLWYPDGQTPQLAPVYDFHSLTIYTRYRYAPLALSLAGERMPNRIELSHIRRLAESCGSDPGAAADLATDTVERLRGAWQREIGDEAANRFPALAEHYEWRISNLPICQT
jgi:serine/threonine-protein kinase HipA